MSESPQFSEIGPGLTPDTTEMMASSFITNKNMTTIIIIVIVISFLICLFISTMTTFFSK